MAKETRGWEAPPTRSLEGRATQRTHSGCEFWRYFQDESAPGADAARAQKAPSLDGLEDTEQTHHDQWDGHPKLEIGGDDARNKQNRSENAAPEPAIEINVSIEETAHKHN